MFTNSGYGPLRKLALLASFTVASQFGATSFAQDNQFSIFSIEQDRPVAANPIGAPPATAAFTNPNPEGVLAAKELSAENVLRAGVPTLTGSKATGTYAHDGRSMFRDPPSTTRPALNPIASTQKIDSAPLQRSLSPLASHRPAASQGKWETKQAPVPIADVSDFKRLDMPPIKSDLAVETESNSSSGQIAQVAFQSNPISPPPATPTRQLGSGSSAPAPPPSGSATVRSQGSATVLNLAGFRTLQPHPQRPPEDFHLRFLHHLQLSLKSAVSNPAADRKRAPHRSPVAVRACKLRLKGIRCVVQQAPIEPLASPLYRRELSKAADVLLVDARLEIKTARVTLATQVHKIHLPKRPVSGCRSGQQRMPKRNWRDAPSRLPNCWPNP